MNPPSKAFWRVARVLGGAAMPAGSAAQAEKKG